MVSFQGGVIVDANLSAAPPASKPLFPLQATIRPVVVGGLQELALK